MYKKGIEKKGKKKSPQRGLGRSKCRYNSDHKQIISIGSQTINADKLTYDRFLQIIFNMMVEQEITLSRRTITSILKDGPLK